MSATTAVEQGWQQSLHERGYAIVPDVVSSSEVMVLLVAMADLVSRRGRAGVRHVLNHPTVNVIANDRRLLGMAQGQVVAHLAKLASSWSATAQPLTRKGLQDGYGTILIEIGVIERSCTGRIHRMIYEFQPRSG